MQRLRPIDEPCAARHFLAVLALVCLPTPVAAQQVELRWRLEPGAEHIYEHVQHSRSSSPIGELTQMTTMTMRIAVLDSAADEAVWTRTTYESIQFVHDGPLGRQEFDSRVDSAPSDPQGTMLAALAGKSFEMAIGPDGRVQRVFGTEALIDDMLAALGTDSPGAAQAREMMEGMMGEDALQAMMQHGMQHVPSGSITPGTTWSIAVDVPLRFARSRHENHYTLNEVAVVNGQRIARIGMRGTVGAFEVDADHPMAGMMQSSGGKATGEIDFDVDRGLLVRSATVVSMSVAFMGETMETETKVEMKLVN